MKPLGVFLPALLALAPVYACAHAEPAAPVSCSAAAADPAIELSLTQLAACLGDPDPQVRDTYALTTLSERLRAGDVPEEELRTLWTTLTGQFEQPDPDGILYPFTALAMSELARTDRISAWLTPDERDEMVGQAANYLRSVTDYRGFVDGEGWRHGIAHGADWLMQLALNPALTPDQAARILDAVASKAAPREHAFIHGEPARLARPILFVLQSGQATEADWNAFFDHVSSPAPMAEWGEAFDSEAGLNQRHNTQALLTVLRAVLGDVGVPEYAGFKTRLAEAASKVP